MKKEMLFCDGCDVTTPADNPSGIWTTIKHNLIEYHLCSQECLKGWAIEHLDLHVPAQDKPACKAQRFLLVDGDTAELTEGVRWERGHVTLDSHSQHCSGRFHCPGLFSTWENFKTAHDGSGVQWIDQEVAE